MTPRPQPDSRPETSLPVLPDPDLLARYSAVDAEMAKSLLADVLEERRQTALDAREERRRQALRGDTLAAALALAAAGYVAGVAWLAATEPPWIGAGAFAAGLLVWYLLQWRRPR